MKTLSITVEYFRKPIKIENERIYRLHIASINDPYMSHDWVEIKRDKMSLRLKTFLQNNNLI